MKGGTQAALALGVGYVLGRQHKMRMATVLAAGAATGGLGGLAGMALKRGMKLLGSSEALSKVSPQLGELADTVRGDLMEAGKAAATAAVTNRIESLTDSLHERAEIVRDPGAAVSDAGKAARSGAGKAASSAASATRRPRRRQEEAPDEETAESNGEETESNGEEEPYAEDMDEQEGYEPEDEEEPEAEEDEADDTEAPPVRRRAPRRRSPVARAGR